MDEQRQDDQLGPTYNSSVLIRDVALKTYLVQWMIEMGGGRGSCRSVLMAQHDDEWYANERVMLNRIITIDLQYLKLFNCVPKLNC